MKPNQNTKSNPTQSTAGHRPAWSRPGVGKVITHRYERRKSRELLRRIDPATAEDWA